MKTNKQVKFHQLFLLLSMSVASFSGAMGNDEGYLNSDPININGYVQQEVAPTDGELEQVRQELKKQKNAIVINKEKKKSYEQLSRSTEKLADVTEDLIEERKESQETIDKYNKKIDCLMAEGAMEGCEEYVKSDKVSVGQAAPMVETKVEDNNSDLGTQEVKILPYTGLTTIMTENENLEANLSAGLKAEANISSKFSVGLGVAYASMTTQDFGGNGYIASAYRPTYNSYYGGREIKMTNMNVSLYSKYFLINNDRFRPYIGAGMGYNRRTLEYTNNNSAPQTYGGYGYGYGYGYSNATFGNEEVVTSNLNAELMVGSEVHFTNTVGLNLELNYVRALGGNLSSENGLDIYNAPDQKRLEDLSEEIGNSNIVSLFAGMLIKF